MFQSCQLLVTTQDEVEFNRLGCGVCADYVPCDCANDQDDDGVPDVCPSDCTTPDSCGRPCGDAEYGNACPIDCPDGAGVDLGCGCNYYGPDACDRCPPSSSINPSPHFDRFTDPFDGDDNGIPDACEIPDCRGVVGGSATPDVGCGCDEPAPSGCDNLCGSTSIIDDCGECGGPGRDACNRCTGDDGYDVDTDPFDSDLNGTQMRAK